MPTAKPVEHPLEIPADALEFQKHQYAFTAHMRDPKRFSAPGNIEDRRLGIYRDLLFNNVEGFISNSFPVLRKLTPDDVWERRVRAFFSQHQSHTPYFAQVCEEFLHWLADERGNHPEDPSFIYELAHYEWVEIALTTSKADQDQPPVDHNGDVFSAIPAISPLAWHLAYHFPVHQISEEFQPDAPSEQPTYLVVYRDRQNEIHFTEINAVTYRLLDLLKENPEFTGEDALKQIALELQHPQPENVIAHGRTLLNDLRERNILIGCKI